MIDLSIIIVNWNAKIYLAKCLESVISESKEYKIELIVVDNYSTDKSVEYLKENFPEVIVIQNNRNLGFSKANNIGISRSKGKFLCLINPDVILHKNCIGNMIRYLKTHAEIGILGPQILGINGKIQRSCTRFPSLWKSLCSAFALDSLFPRIELFSSFALNHWSHDSLREVDVIKGCFWLINRRSLNAVGLLDERFFMYAEDIDWCKRFWEEGYSVVFFSNAKVVHYGGASSSNDAVRFYIEMKRANLQYWMKYNEKISSRFLYTIICGLHHIVRIIGYSLAYLVKTYNKKEIRFKITRSKCFLMWLINNINNYGQPVEAFYYQR